MDECWVIKLYDDSDICGVFLTEKEAKIAAQRWLDERWADEELFEKDIKSEKEQWEKYGRVDDTLYIKSAPLGVLKDYWKGDFYGT